MAAPTPDHSTTGTEPGMTPRPLGDPDGGLPAGESRRPARLDHAERDVIALGILTAAIVLFIGTGSRALMDTVGSLFADRSAADPLLVTALLLNVALIIFGWRRYRDLANEVRERREAEATANLLARTDPLTGLLNRRAFTPAAQDLIADGVVTGEQVAVMMFDLDAFKKINDIYGHRCGDAVLVEVAARLRDVLPPRAIVGRLGGDEFACAVPFAAGRTGEIDSLANVMLDAIARPIPTGAAVIETSTSIGIAGPTPNLLLVAEELVHHADLAMYQAKKCGRGRHYWFEPDMAREMRFRSEIERDIREGIIRGEFVPYYEKQVDLETGKITGFEMLARWQSPTYGLMAPEAFIGIAEEIGAIGALSEMLIALALRDAREWDPSITLSVNVSPVQLRDPWFAQKLLKLLTEANFPPARLEIEITETCLHENLGVVRSLITSLRNQGVQVSLDDFGTGYSSLAQLRTLPFDRIKIDRSFVATLGDSPDSATIIGAITSLGQGMGLPITAEGIETPEVLAALRGFGSFKGQGYLYGRPGDAASVRRWLADEDMTTVEHSDHAGTELPRQARG